MAAIDDGELPAEDVAAKYGVRPEGNPNRGEHSRIAGNCLARERATATARQASPVAVTVLPMLRHTTNFQEKPWQPKFL